MRLFTEDDLFNARLKLDDLALEKAEEFAEIFNHNGWTWRGAKDSPTGDDIYCKICTLISQIHRDLVGRQCAFSASTGRLQIRVVKYDHSLIASLELVAAHSTISI